MAPRFLWSCFTNRTMSQETFKTWLNNFWRFSRKSLQISVVNCFGKISVLDVLPISECTSWVNFDVPLLSVLSPIFLTQNVAKYLKGSFMQKWLAASTRKLHFRYLTAFCMYFLIQFWCRFTISIIIHFHLFILSLVLSYSLSLL